MLAPLAAVAVALSTLLWMPGSTSVTTLTSIPWPPGEAQAEPAKAGKAPKGEAKAGELIELEVRDVIPIEEANTHAVVLVSKDQQFVLPIFVTEEAAVSIAFRLAERNSPHPLAADLLDDVVKQMGGDVTQVSIDDVQDDIYLSRVTIRQGQKNLKIDARPSDAIAMALTGHARIFCTQKVMAHAGITKGEIDSLRDQMGVGGGGHGPGIPGDEEVSPIELPSGEENIEL